MPRRLLIFNGLAALAIPIHHAGAYGLQAMFHWTDRYMPVTVPNYDLIHSAAFDITMFIRTLAVFAVPAFFFVSGYFVGFMAKGNNFTLKWNSFLPRIQILAIPLLGWTVFRFLMIGHIPGTLNEILNPYFFIFVLIQFYLLAPLISEWADTHWKTLLAVAGSLQLLLVLLGVSRAVNLTIPGQDLILDLPRWLILKWPFWFPFGVVTALHLEEIRKPLIKVRWALIVALPLLPMLSVFEAQVIMQLTGDMWLGPTFGGVAKAAYSLTFILCVLTFVDFPIPFSKTLSALGTKSLGIYMANIPAIYAVALMLYHFMPWSLGNQLLYQSLLVAAGLGGPLLLMEMVRRSRARTLYRYAFG